ncbi:MAG: acyl-CoA thioesterase [Bacteroidales bacterium]|nr:acyl-CoA thioesterase [Bacteroidales bacterium]
MELRPYRHEVKYYECDRMGITHHSNYIRFMEEARVDWMDQLGFGFERMEAEGVVSPVVSVECRYRQPSTFKDVIDISVAIAETTPLKVVFAYTMRVGDRTVCTATSMHCFLEGGKPVSLEKRFPEFYARVKEVIGKGVNN